MTDDYKQYHDVLKRINYFISLHYFLFLTKDKTNCFSDLLIPIK